MKFSGIHWFAITIFLDIDKVKAIWAQFFALGLGVLVEYEGFGGRRYKKRLEALQSAKIYYDYNDKNKQEEHCHMELPGGACECLTPSVFSDLVKFLQGNDIRFNIKRVDFAFDGGTFTPRDFYEASQSENVISLVKRQNSDSVQWKETPFKLRENGEVGTHTAYFGSSSSHRMVRVYDRRGDTRLEFQSRDERAHKICLDVFSHAWADWEGKVKEHIKQFLDFKDIDWWDVFMSTTEKAHLIISAARKVALEKMEEWFVRQVVVPLSVHVDIYGQEGILKLVWEAKQTRNRSRYASVLQLAAT